jgi:putative membrane protein
MKLDRFFKQFNWRFLLVRIVVNALALAGTAAFLPKIYFVDKTWGSWLLMALMLGVLNALLKPVLQFLTLQFIFVTYGLVIVLVNALLLWLLSILFPNRFAVDSIWWLLIAGLVLGLLSSFLESLFGLTMPIVPDEPPTLRHQIEEQARQTDWLAAANSETIPATLASELPAQEAPAPSAVKAGASAGAEASAAAEGAATTEARAAVPAGTEEADEAGAAAKGPEAAPEPDEEQEEERS